MKKKNKKEKSNFLKNIKKMWKYIKDSKFYLLGHVFVTIAGAVLGAISPLYVSKVILNLTDGVVNQLIVSAAFVLIIDLAFYIVSFFQAFFWQKIYQKTLINLQFDVAKETLKLDFNGVWTVEAIDNTKYRLVASSTNSRIFSNAALISSAFTKSSALGPW